ncbi:MAG TPA: DMT family transporter [Gallionella sp.]
MSSNKNAMSIAGTVVGSLVWGLVWYPFRVLEEAGVSGAQATLVAYLLAMLFGVFLLPRVWRELPRAGWWGILLVLSIGWTNLGYVLAILHGEVMRVLLLFYLAPLWTVLLSYWVLDERLNRYGYLIILLSFLGAVIMLWEPSLGLPLPQNFAEWIGMSAGLAFAFSNVVSRRANHMSVEAKSYGVWFGTVLLTAPLLWMQGGLPGQLAESGPQAWLILGLLGIVMCGTGFAVQYAVSYLPANRAITLFMFELVVAAVSSYFLAGESMTLREWTGALLIVSASLLSGKLHAGARAA